MACVPPCPTGSIDNWRLGLRAAAYSVQDQLGWEELPGEKALPEAVDAGAGEEPLAALAETPVPAAPASFSSAGASVPPRR
ncbi:hypothetical protein G6F40_017320 [Rhizopus arrhizus]|nr:hypothetical protein G6F40_017320 [Rhizopus arrhizus]